MSMRVRWAIAPILYCLCLLSVAEARVTPLRGASPNRLLTLVRDRGRIPVIVGVRDDDWRPEGSLPKSEVPRQRERGRRKISEVTAIHPQIKEVGLKLKTVPFFLAWVNEGALHALLDDDRVKSIEEDLEFELALVQSTDRMGAQASHARQPAIRGANQIIVVMDNGVDHTHPFLRGRVLHAWAACYSNVVWDDPGNTVFDPVVTEVNACPNGQAFQERPTTAKPFPGVPCSVTENYEPFNECHHGTHVAGVAAGSRDAMTQTELDDLPDGQEMIVGVAPAAQVVPINIAGVRCSSGCSTSSPTTTSVGRQSNVLYGLDWVASDVNVAYPDRIAAVNMSLRFKFYYADRQACDAAHPVFEGLIANLNSLGIAVVAATGNEAQIDATTIGRVGLPSCISNVISVSATTDTGTDQVAPYANNAPLVDVYAPGGVFGVAGSGIVTSQNSGCTGCNRWIETAGTSMAAPHVSGAFALLREATAAISPRPSVRSLLGTLVRTGAMVTDTRAGFSNITKPRINVNEALDQPLELPPPTNFSAIASGTSVVNLTWSAGTPSVPRTSHRLQFRTSATAAWTQATETGGTSYRHESVVPGSVYQYEVTTIDAALNKSTAAIDFALPLIHQDEPLAAGATLIRGLHVATLRQAADAWRTFAGLSVAFTYEPATGFVNATDFLGVVDNLNIARSAIGLPPFTYSGLGNPAVGGVVDHRHVQQLRSAMQ